MSLSLSLTNGMGLRSSASFSPLSLFSASEAGAWYDPSDLSTMWADTAGTTPASVDGAVARIDDKSGNGNNAIQATAANMPLLKLDANGRYYLEFDGANDNLRASFSITNPFDRISAIRQISWTLNDYIFGGASSSQGSLYQSSATPSIRTIDTAALPPNTSAAVGSNVVVTERHADTASRLAVDGGAYITGSTGAANPGGITIGGNSGLTVFANVAVYGVVMIGRSLTEGEISSLCNFMAGKALVAL